MHVPDWQVALQGPAQADEQQTFDTQKPFTQSFAWPHAAPLFSLNAAVTVVAEVTTIEQLAWPLEVHPVQFANVALADCEAAKLTDVPWGTSAEQVLPQLMPMPGVVDRTAPAPVGPSIATLSRNEGGVTTSGPWSAGVSTAISFPTSATASGPKLVASSLESVEPIPESVPSSIEPIASVFIASPATSTVAASGGGLVSSPPSPGTAIDRSIVASIASIASLASLSASRTGPVKGPMQTSWSQ
jgi:hypothetical protein